MTLETPRAYILRQIKTLGKQADDEAIAGMCRARFGNEVAPERVAELRRAAR